MRLLPWGLAAFSDQAIRRFNGRFAPFAEALGGGDTAEQLRSLEQELEAADTIEQAQVVLEQLLPSLFKPNRLDARLVDVLAKLYDEPMAHSVGWAAAASGYLQRQFERKCTELAGLPPKRLLKVDRFIQARLRLSGDPELDLRGVMSKFG